MNINHDSIKQFDIVSQFHKKSPAISNAKGKQFSKNILDLCKFGMLIEQDAGTTQFTIIRSV